MLYVVKRALILHEKYDFKVYTEDLFPIDVIPDFVWKVKVDYEIGNNI